MSISDLRTREREKTIKWLKEKIKKKKQGRKEVTKRTMLKDHKTIIQKVFLILTPSLAI